MPTSSDANTVQSVDAKTVNGWLKTKEMILVDVRETFEYELDYISGSFLLPMSSFNIELFPTFGAKKIVLHCAVGKRSETVGEMLINAGHTNIFHLEGGIIAWNAAGFATKSQT